MTKIMVVDDAAFMRMILKDILNSEFEVVAEAANGEEAVTMYKQWKPDLVTLDITMPDMDGISALKEIRKYDPQAKVIMCSAVGQQHLVVSAILAGAKDFVVKPFQKDRVLEAVGKALK